MLLAKCGCSASCYATKLDGKGDFSSQLIEMTMVKNLWSQKEMKVDAEGRQLFLRDLTMHYNSEGEALGIVNHGKVVALHDRSGNPVKTAICLCFILGPVT